MKTTKGLITMPLESVPNMLERARRGKYAVGYFESWNLESLQAVIEAAEESRSPVIIGFNGEFLSHFHGEDYKKLSWYGRMGVIAAESSSVPCGFIFNECCQDNWLREAVKAGFNTIMPSNEKFTDYHDYKQWVVSLTRYAHKHNVAVEAEIGTLPCGYSDRRGKGGELTNSKLAADFVTETGIDLLAISVGNVHIMAHGRKHLNLELIGNLHKHVRVFLVLHGGTGIADDSLRKAVSFGVTKINFGTILKQRYLSAIRACLRGKFENPHNLLGDGGSSDLMVAGRNAVSKAVLEKIKILGCYGKA